MDDEETIKDTFTINPRKHDRWTLIILGLGFAADIMEVVANNASTLLMVAAEHSKQKNIDDDFMEIVRQQ